MALLRSKKRPFVTLVGAMTLDGKIASRTGDSRISSKEDLKTLHRLRSRNDAIMIGIGTLIQDDPRLTVRLVKGRNPIRVIVDRSARTPPNSRIFKKGPTVIIAVTKNAPRKRVEALKRAGARILRTGNSQINLLTLLTRLYRLGIKRILLEGGGNLNWSMISNGLVDNITVTVAPMIIGGSHATTLVEGDGVTKVNQAINLALTEARRQRNEIVLTYKVT
ncbi:MAG: 2,5-diamino-6-(ribosylamino)-4(3H)-pyrimidinone 5'-phosphate reductase [Candidatus Bathyarchaeia archaeon]|jgi:2,5-diamino-6-(ribosylamino)-4(3H)-pyrimidinone 5'-phosphate reductase